MIAQTTPLYSAIGTRVQGTNPLDYAQQAANIRQTNASTDATKQNILASQQNVAASQQNMQIQASEEARLADKYGIERREYETLGAIGQKYYDPQTKQFDAENFVAEVRGTPGISFNTIDKIDKSLTPQIQTQLITKYRAAATSPDGQLDETKYLDLVAKDQRLGPQMADTLVSVAQKNKDIALKQDFAHRATLAEMYNRAIADGNINTSEAVAISNYAHDLGVPIDTLPKLTNDPAGDMAAVKQYVEYYRDPAKAQQDFENKLAERKQKEVERSNKANEYLDSKRIDAAAKAAVDKSALDGIDPDTGKPYTQGQKLAAGYALRVGEAQGVIESLASKGFNATDVKSAVLKPDKTNAIKDPQLRQYAQAMRTFINAVLRRESGAAISPSEFDNANAQYFAQLNDDAKTLEQKRNTRLQVLAALKAEAGSAYGKVAEQYQKELGGISDEDALNQLFPAKK